MRAGFLFDLSQFPREVPNAFQVGFGLADQFFGVINGGAVVRRYDHKAETIRVVSFRHILAGDEIAERFGHFFAVDEQDAAVRPIFHERRFALGSCLLGDFRFVVGEFQLHRSAVEVVLRAEVMLGNSRVFNMPAGPAFSPGRIPRRLVFFVRFSPRFSEDEIIRGVLIRVFFQPHTGVKFFQILAR